MIQHILGHFWQTSQIFSGSEQELCIVHESTLDVSLFLAEELLMERCVLFERCELAPANERDRFLEHKQNKIT